MPNKRWQYVRSILAGIGIAILGAAAYDYLAKPAGTLLLATYSSISESVRDQIYWDAALDPRTGVTEQSLSHVLFLFLFLLLGPMLSIAFIIARDLRKPSNPVPPNTEEQPQQAKERNIARRALVTIFVAAAALTLNVYIEGTFHTNLARCAPHISEAERLKFLADFTTMQNRRDYERIDAKLRTIAQQKGFTHIQGTGLW